MAICHTTSLWRPRLWPLVALGLAIAAPIDGWATSRSAVRNSAGAAALAPADRRLAEEAARYLGGMKTAEARFTQTDPRGAVTHGLFYLQRPGKARFAYDPPTDLTVVADGANVNVADGRLKTFDQYPLSSTPLSLLLGSEVKFDKAVLVTAVSRSAGGFTLTVQDPRRRAEGQLTLTFNTAPMALTGWTVVDGQGQRTGVRLEELKTGQTLDAKLFELHNPTPKAFRVKP